MSRRPMPISRPVARALCALAVVVAVVGTMLGSAPPTAQLTVSAPSLEVGVGVTRPDTSAGRHAAEAQVPVISRSFSLVRVASSTACGRYAVPISTYTTAPRPLVVDLVIPFATPCGGVPMKGLDAVLSSLACSTDGKVTSTGAECWAANAYSFFLGRCRTAAACPELEVLDEPAGPWFWGTKANTPANADAYAGLLATTWTYFHRRLGAKSPKLLASYDGGYSNSSSWGDEVWNNTRGIDVARYVDGITFHPYSSCSAPVRSCSDPVDNRSTITSARDAALSTGHPLPPVYVTEIGWNTNAAAGWWTEAQQANDYCSFVDWAWKQPFIVQVIAYAGMDTGTKWFGLTRWDEGGSTTNLSEKPGWHALVEAEHRAAC